MRTRSSTDGKPIVRLSVQALRALIAREHPNEWAAYRRDEAIPKQWVESDVIRIQARRNEENESLPMGAEIPVGGPDEFLALITALVQLYQANRPQGADQRDSLSG